MGGGAWPQGSQDSNRLWLSPKSTWFPRRPPPHARPSCPAPPARPPQSFRHPRWPPGPVQLLLPASGDLKAGGSRASDLSLQEVGSPATGVPQVGDVLGMELRTQGGDNSGSPAFESLVPRVPPAGDGTGGWGRAQGPGEPSKVSRLGGCTGPRTSSLSLQRFILTRSLASRTPCSVALGWGRRKRGKCWPSLSIRWKEMCPGWGPGHRPPQSPTVCPSGAGPCPPTWGSPRAIALPRASRERPGRSGRPALSARPLQDVTSSLTGRLGPRPTDRAGKALPAPGLRTGTSAPVPTSASAGASPGGPGRAGPPGPQRPPAWALGRRPTPGEGVQEGEGVGGTRPGSRKQTHPEEAAGKGAAGPAAWKPPTHPAPGRCPSGRRGAGPRGPRSPVLGSGTAGEKRAMHPARFPLSRPSRPGTAGIPVLAEPLSCRQAQGSHACCPLPRSTAPGLVRGPRRRGSRARPAPGAPPRGTHAPLQHRLCGGSAGGYQVPHTGRLKPQALLSAVWRLEPETQVWAGGSPRGLSPRRVDGGSSRVPAWSASGHVCVLTSPCEGTSERVGTVTDEMSSGGPRGGKPGWGGTERDGRTSNLGAPSGLTLGSGLSPPASDA